MRLLKSRRGVDGINYHTCPGDGYKHLGDSVCRGCVNYQSIERLPATYRLHCSWVSRHELRQIKPSKAAARIPPSLGTDPLALDTHQLLEPKLDGVRIFMHLLKSGNRLTTRRKNKAGLYNEVTDQLPHLRDLAVPEFYWGAVLDGEIQMPSKGTSSGLLGSTMSVIGSSPERALAHQERWGYVQYQVFDLPFSAQGDDLRNYGLACRLMHLADFWMKPEMLVAEQTHVQPIHSEYCLTTYGKRAFVQECLELGYEGAILKNLKATYGQLRGWIKIKEKHTLDLQIVDWEPGKAGGKHENGLGSLMGAVRRVDEPLSGVLQVVCTVSPGTDIQRAYWHDKLATLTTGEIHAANFIVEVEFQNWTKGYRLRHPRVLRYRTDRSEPSVVDLSAVKRS